MAGETWLLVASCSSRRPASGSCGRRRWRCSPTAPRPGVEQGYAVALTNLAWSTGQTLGSAGGARLGEAYGDALPYLALAGMSALTLLALTRPRYSAALAGK